MNEHPTETEKRKLAKHIVQRRRPDIRRDFNDMGTTFPDRTEQTINYSVKKEKRKLIDDVIAWGFSRINAAEGKQRKRVRTWSMLGLLRAIASSPEAALAGLKTRAESIEADEILKRKTESLEIRVFDQSTERGVIDEVTGADDLLDEDTSAQVQDFIEQFSAMNPVTDEKFLALKKGLKGMMKDGFNPVVFCRFVPTVDMLVSIIKHDGDFKDVHVEGITGRLNPEERNRRIEALAPLSNTQKILVATDCLAEGINLQDHFNAVIHYDLSWSPTTHEQREGRVDRFGQTSPEVRALSLVGDNNRIDGYVANIIIEKQRTIRASLGISVPAPNAREAISQAITDDWLGGLPNKTRQVKLFQFLPEEDAQEQMAKEWMSTAEREKKRRTRFSQSSIDVSEVQEEVASIRQALGTPKDVHRFLEMALQANNVRPSATEGSLTLEFSTASAPHEFVEAVQLEKQEQIAVVDDLSPVPQGWKRIVRTSRVVEEMADYIMGQTLDPKRTVEDGVFPSQRQTRWTNAYSYCWLAVDFHSPKPIVRRKPRCLLRVFSSSVSQDNLNHLRSCPKNVSNPCGTTPSGNVPGGQAEMILNKQIPKFSEPIFKQRLELMMEAEGERIREAHQRVLAVS